MSVTEIFADLKSKVAQRNKLMAELEICVLVHNQGIDPSKVASYGWKTSLVPADVLNRAAMAHKSLIAAKREKYPWYGEWLKKSGFPLWYNYVTMTDGTTKTLNPYIKAV